MAAAKQPAGQAFLAGDPRMVSRPWVAYFDSLSARLAALDGLAASTSYADDAAAATGGVPIGGLYRTGSVVKVRLA